MFTTPKNYSKREEDSTSPNSNISLLLFYFFHTNLNIFNSQIHFQSTFYFLKFNKKINNKFTQFDFLPELKKRKIINPNLSLLSATVVEPSEKN